MPSNYLFVQMIKNYLS